MVGMAALSGLNALSTKNQPKRSADGQTTLTAAPCLA
jgi:hypothetical protein